MDKIGKIFDFLHCIEKLKCCLRYNVTSTGRKESSAEHSWRLSMAAVIFAQELDLKIDMLKAIKIALVHDIAEAETGDIDAIEIQDGKITRQEKLEMEKSAIKKMISLLPPITALEMKSLWLEYEAGSTEEARFIKALDKIETLTQLVEAGYKTYDRPEFIAGYADQAVAAFPALLPALNALKAKLRREFEKGKIPWPA